MNARILVGVCGGVAAFKTAALVSRLVQDGHTVSVLMTPSAKQFVGPATFAALTGTPVVEDLFDPAFPLGAHIELSRTCELFVIAPATANLLGKTANGLADDLISTTYLAFNGRVFMAPAMNGEMWAKASVQRNVKFLESDGVEMIGPTSGWLSCRQQGDGRMAEPEQIIESIRAAFPCD
jgi:phosphopantothenoylcysteine decarboxylase